MGRCAVLEPQTTSVTPRVPDRESTRAAATTHAPSPPSPAQTDRLVAGACTTWNLAHAPVIDVGDAVIGTRADQETSIYALDAHHLGPRIQARVSGDPAIRLRFAPTHLPAAGGTFDPSMTIKLAFLPDRIGSFEASLQVDILDAPLQTLHIPIRAGAHPRGGMTRAEQAEAEQAAAHAQAEATARAQRERTIDQAIATEFAQARPAKDGDKSHLSTAREDARTALEELDQARRDGLMTAHTEIGAFVRAEPTPEQPSLLEQLAWAALDLATLSLAGVIARSLAPKVAGLFTRSASKATPTHPLLPARSTAEPAGEDHPPGEAFVELVSDGMKHVLEGGGKRALDHVQGTGDGATRSAPAQAASTDPKAAFFATQFESLREITAAQKQAVVIRAHDALLPMLRTQPAAAITSMNAIAAAIKEAAKAAHDQQAVRTSQHWVRYIHATDASAGAANTRLDENHPLRTIDGLVDVEITPDLRHPEAPVKVSKSRLEGVTAAVLNRLADRRLNELGLAVRAAGTFDSPTASITAVRQPDGTVQFTENTSVEWHPGTWFARKADAYGRGKDPVWGARLMLEREVMNQSLGQVLAGTASTTTRQQAGGDRVE